MNTRLFAIAVPVIALLAGCETSPLTPTATPPAPAPPTFSDATSSDFGVRSYLPGPPLSTQDRQEMHLASVDAMKQFKRIVLDAESPAEADYLTQEVLDANPGSRIHSLTASTYMLRHVLLGDNPPRGPQASGLAQKYVDMLVEAGSPEATLVAAAFEVHGDRWSDSYRAEVGAAAAERARSFIGGELDCSTCTIEAIQNRLSDPEVGLAQRSYAAPQLRAADALM